MQDEIKMLKYTSEKLIPKLFVCIGLILVTLIGAWILNDEKAAYYNQHWYPLRVGARGNAVEAATELVLLQGQQATNMLASSQR